MYQKRTFFIKKKLYNKLICYYNKYRETFDFPSKPMINLFWFWYALMEKIPEGKINEKENQQDRNATLIQESSHLIESFDPINESLDVPAFLSTSGLDSS